MSLYFKRFFFGREKWGVFFCLFPIHFKQKWYEQELCKGYEMKINASWYQGYIIFDDWHFLLQLSLNFSLWRPSATSSNVYCTWWISNFVSCSFSICPFPISGHRYVCAFTYAVPFLFSPCIPSTHNLPAPISKMKLLLMTHALVISLMFELWKFLESVPHSTVPIYNHEFTEFEIQRTLEVVCSKSFQESWGLELTVKIN